MLAIGFRAKPRGVSLNQAVGQSGLTTHRE